MSQKNVVKFLRESTENTFSENTDFYSKNGRNINKNKSWKRKKKMYTLPILVIIVNK